MTKKRDYGLDILRTMACLMVLGVHLVQRVSIPGTIGAFFQKGSTGVSFFFILSGFLSYYSLDRIFNNNEISLKQMIKYWKKRAIHILPLYYLAILFYLVFYCAINQIPTDSSGLYWVRYFLFLNLWIPSEEPFWTNLGAVWSISVFVLFYIIAPFYYRVVKRFSISCLVVILSYAILKITDVVGLHDIPLRHLFYFFLGIMLKLAIDEHREFAVISNLTVVSVFFLLSGSGIALAAPFMVSIFILA